MNLKKVWRKMDMTYHELLEKYKNGTLEEEKYNEISEEIEKHSAISEYLFDNDEIPETDFEIVNESENETALNDFSASIKKAIRKAFIKAGAITFVFSVCVVLGIVFGLPKLVDCFYYNPSKKVSGMTDCLDLDVDVYSEMFLPFRSSVACYSESNGYGEYDVEFHEGVSFTGEISMAAGKINKNKLKMYDLSFFRHISMNSFNLLKADVGSRLASDAFEYAGGYEIDELEEKTHYNATVTLDRVYTYNEFVDFCKENDINPRWNAVCYKDEKRENLLPDTNRHSVRKLCIPQRFPLLLVRCRLRSVSFENPHLKHKQDVFSANRYNLSAAVHPFLYSVFLQFQLKYRFRCL